MTTEPKHTPTKKPYKVINEGKTNIKFENLYSVEDALFFNALAANKYAKKINSHDALVEALERIDEMALQSESDPAMMAIMLLEIGEITKAALALAKGEA